MRILSGVQPSGSGALHLGNYFGAVKQHLELQHQPQYEVYYFIADFHAMTTVQDAELLRKSTLNIALDYLALGLDPKKAVFFRQSDVPEVLELAWALSVTSGKGLLDRAHSYKDKVQKGIQPSIGLYYYPVLMAADMLLYQANLVPVGQDQKQHVEITQDLAQAFNHRYKTELLKRPEILLSRNPKVPGIDGEKMSKSYGNTIDLFEPLASAQKKIMAIKTDSLPVEAPKDPDQCLVMGFLRLFAMPEETASWEARYRQGGVGYGQVKKRVAELYQETFAPFRKKREELKSNLGYVEQVLKDGSTRARKVAMQTLHEVRKVVGLLP